MSRHLELLLTSNNWMLLTVAKKSVTIDQPSQLFATVGMGGREEGRGREKRKGKGRKMEMETGEGVGREGVQRVSLGLGWEED